MLGHLRALTPGGLTIQSLAAETKSLRRMETEPGHKCPETTYHLVSIPAGFSVVQLAQNALKPN